MDRLFIGVLGHRNSGKSTTWNSLFKRTVKTGKKQKKLKLLDGKSTKVFVVSGSPEERNKYAGDIITNKNHRIILCSMQYTEAVQNTIDFATDPDNDFEIFIQWLNPGHNDSGQYFDHLGLMPSLVAKRATFSIRDAKCAPKDRVEEIRQFIFGWATARRLTF